MTKKSPKIATIIGARPQFIKASPVTSSIKEFGLFSEIIIHTGQHFDKNMSKVFFDEMNIPKPEYNLEINQLSDSEMIDTMIDKIKRVLINDQINAVLVYGDTNSTLAGSISASICNLPLFHIEAGLRSFNREMPEENNRIISDHLSTLLFCPTNVAMKNLRNEGINDGLHLAGDVMFDAYKKFSLMSDQGQSKIKMKSKYVLSTIHRRENINSKEKLTEIFSNLDSICNQIDIIMPLHPHTKKIINKYQIKSKVRFIEPAGYIKMLHLLNNCEMIITDSGGLQKESYFARKKCIIVRTETEWKELVESGASTLCNPESIFEKFQNISKDKCNFSENLYGNGDSSFAIVKSINSFFSSFSFI